MLRSCLCALLVLIPAVLCDIYFHNPRGTNNRLNEKSAQRKNANRMFDSQNNNRGGYNVGDKTDEAFETEDGQFRMQYFQSSADYNGKTQLTMEWTNQHGCGGDEDKDPHKLNCNIVFQYMCKEDQDSATGNLDDDLLRNGATTQTQGYEKPSKDTLNSEDAYKARRAASVSLDRGLNEDFEYYDDCYIRQRNNGLFRADQGIGRNSLRYNAAVHTRQNRKGTRRGYDCPEERDYYPYWHPNPWKDIMVLANDETQCNDYKSQSFNVKPYHKCIEYFDNGVMKHFSKYNNQQSCTQNGGQWTQLYNYLEISNINNQGDCNNAGYNWNIPHDTKDLSPKCLVQLSQPECQQAPWTRTNHLGNAKEGVPNNITWTIPHFPSGNTQRCVLRARYNISSDDYNPYTTDSTFNGAKSLVRNNPFVEVGSEMTPLRLAINTAQFGRTFQDRTHVFKLVPRTAEMGTKTIHNLNVRGKRGNIVQTYPAVEYDFVPNDLTVNNGDLIHVQWAGSNTHNNGNPAGDGQAGDAGQGQAGTDRHNMVEIKAADLNFPLPIEATGLWGQVSAVWTHHDRASSQGLTGNDIAISLATAGHFHCHTSGCDERPGNTEDLDADLNNAPASYSGIVLQVNNPGTWHYMSSRNNAFTNRSQKGKLTVV